METDPSREREEPTVAGGTRTGGGQVGHCFSDPCRRDRSCKQACPCGLCLEAQSHSVGGFHRYRSAPHSMTRPVQREAGHPPAGSSVVTKGTLLLCKAWIILQPVPGLVPAPAGLPDSQGQEKRQREKGWETAVLCSNLRETARRKDMPLIMTPLCFLKASF